LFFFFFQAEDGIRDWRDWSSDVCSSDLQENTYIKEAKFLKNGFNFHLITFFEVTR